jgi:lipopolysaccharide cholinephosphotransferase
MEDFLTKLHFEIVNILKEVKKICNENNLRYYLVGGTLLGALRHKGFIPWDDDLDIGMPREDFNRFIAICEKQLPEHLELMWITTNKRHWYPFAKVQIKNTLFLQSNFKSSKHNFGIFIDVFPIDEDKGLSEEVFKRKRKINVLNSLMQQKVIPTVKSFKNLLSKCASAFVSTKRLQRMQQKLMTKNNRKGFDYYANYASNYSIKKQMIPKQDYGEGVLLEFEGEQYNAPVNYDAVLTSIYGSDYMQLPPKEMQRTHKPYKIIYSDGTEITF